MLTSALFSPAAAGNNIDIWGGGAGHPVAYTGTQPVWVSEYFFHQPTELRPRQVKMLQRMLRLATAPGAQAVRELEREVAGDAGVAGCVTAALPRWVGDGSDAPRRLADRVHAISCRSAVRYSEDTVRIQ